MSWTLPKPGLAHRALPVWRRHLCSANCEVRRPEKSNDGGAGIDDELPGLGKIEQWPGHGPYRHEHHSSDERAGLTGHLRRARGYSVKRRLAGPPPFCDVMERAAE